MVRLCSENATPRSLALVENATPTEKDVKELHSSPTRGTVETVSEIVQELKRVDAAIKEELDRSKQALSPLLREREQLARVGISTPTGQAELILELAAQQTAGFTMTEAYRHVRDALGPTVKQNQVSAWLTKLRKQGKLKKLKRGLYALP